MSQKNNANKIKKPQDQSYFEKPKAQKFKAAKSRKPQPKSNKPMDMELDIITPSAPVKNVRQKNRSQSYKEYAKNHGETPKKQENGKKNNYKSNSKKNYYNKAKNQESQNKPPVRIAFLGGLNEIGKNMTLFECMGDMVLLDCGMAFPDGDMLGVDLVIPDFSYVIENKDKLRGIVITHAHEDHIG